MSLHNLKPAAGSVKSSKRIARGEGSGHGGTLQEVTKELNLVRVIQEKWIRRRANALTKTRTEVRF